MSILEQDLRDRLREVRNSKGLSEDEVARRLGKSGNSFVSRVEKGPTKITISLLNKLCSVYEVLPLELLQPAKKNDKQDESSAQQRKDFLAYAMYRADTDLPDAAIASIKKQLSLVRKIGLVAKKLDGVIALKEIKNIVGVEIPDSINGARKQGAEAARILRKELKLGDQPLSDILLLVWSELMIPVFGVDLGENSWGLYSIDPYANPFIVYSTSHDFTQRNVFTIAHELGHHIFEHGTTKIELSEGEPDLQERRADSFAQELLVPTDILRRIYDERGFSLLRTIHPKHIVELCEYFKVSFLMMAYCLLRGNKISGSEFEGFKTYSKEFLLKDKEKLGYHPERYMVKPRTLDVQLREIISIGLRKGVVTKLEASKLLDITPTEAGQLI